MFFFVSGNCAVHAIVCGNLVVVMLEWQFSLVGSWSGNLVAVVVGSGSAADIIVMIS